MLGYLLNRKTKVLAMQDESLPKRLKLLMGASLFTVATFVLINSSQATQLDGLNRVDQAVELGKKRIQLAESSGGDYTPVPTRPSEWEESFDASTSQFSSNQSVSAEYPTLSASTLQSTQQAIEQYTFIVQNGGWPAVPGRRVMKIGSRGKDVSLLRQRLSISGDLQSQSGRDSVFDSYVAAAVKRFQARHGINADGVVGKSTFEALNVSAEERLSQLRVNLVRLHGFAAELPDRYVLVNIPGQEVEAVAANRVASRHTAIVGKPDRQTPILSAKIHELNFSPYWTVPKSIIRKDIIPRMQTDPSYLKRYVIRIFTHKGDEVDPQTIDWHSDQAMQYVFRQDPGEDINSMGAVKLNFFNPHAVFMHDTPQKELFSEDYRAYSSGCIRVQNIEHLLTWILQAQEQEYWSRSKVDALIRSGERIDVSLEKRVPIFMVYITAWASANGVVHFRNDIYERDGVNDTTELASY